MSQIQEIMSSSMIVLIPRFNFVHGDGNFPIKKKLETLCLKNRKILRKGRIKSWIGAVFIFVSGMETKLYCDIKEGR